MESFQYVTDEMNRRSQASFWFLTPPPPPRATCWAKNRSSPISRGDFCIIIKPWVTHGTDLCFSDTDGLFLYLSEE